MYVLYVYPINLHVIKIYAWHGKRWVVWWYSVVCGVKSKQQCSTLNQSCLFLLCSLLQLVLLLFLLNDCLCVCMETNTYFLCMCTLMDAIQSSNKSDEIENWWKRKKWHTNTTTMTHELEPVFNRVRSQSGNGLTVKGTTFHSFGLISNKNITYIVILPPPPTQLRSLPKTLCRIAD